MSAQRFKNIAHTYCGIADSVAANLVDLYTAADRHYHNIDHVLYCIDILDAVTHKATDVVSIKAALVYHDVIYSTDPDVNAVRSSEDRSADLALVDLAVCNAPAFYNRVVRLIDATKHRGDLVIYDEQVMADVDLAGLGADWERFSRDGEHIRLEYSNVPDEQWRAGRASFMKSLLNRNTIYYTPAFRLLFEARARENLQRVIDMLS